MNPQDPLDPNAQPAIDKADVRLTDCSDDEELLADVVEQIVAELEAGKPLSLEGCVRQFPQWEHRLRELWLPIQSLVHLPLAGSPHRPGLSSTCAEESERVPSFDERPEALVRWRLGDFRLLGEVGRGGMGIVYEAEQLSLGRRVALKVLPFAAVLDERQWQRFQNEARAAAGLQHPGIVPVFSVGCDRGVHYYAMQFIEGQSLAVLIAERRAERSGEAQQATGGGTPPNTTTVARLRSTVVEPPRQTAPRGDRWCLRAAEIGEQVAEALAYAHSVAVVHRDVKPSNLLLDGRGRAWVTDFGLAQVETQSGLTMTGDLVGTLRYMSPEQRRGKPGVVDHRADIYSLGATLFELLALEALHRGQTRTELLQDDPEAARRLRELNPHVPRDLETIILKATATEPADRYATALELAADLKRFRNHEPILARRPSPIERLGRWARRHPRVTWGGAFVLLVVAVAASLSAVFIAQARNTAELAVTEGQIDRQKLEWQREIATDQTRRAERLNARLLAERGAKLLNAGQPEGLLDLAEACETVRESPRERRQLANLWAVSCEPWRDQLWLRDSLADVFTFSADGRYLALAGGTSCRLWSIADRQFVGQPMDLRRPVSAVVFSPDQRLLATHSVEGVARLWRVPDGVPATDEMHHNQVPVEFPANGQTAARFTPDGSLLITAGADATVRTWSVTTGKPVSESLRLGGEVWGLAVSPEGKTLVTTTVDGSVRLWKINRGTDEQAGFAVSWQPIETPAPLTQIAGASSGKIGFSGNGEWLATQSGIWSANTWRRVPGIQHEGSEAFAFSADNRLFATAGRDWMLRVWDLSNGRAALPPIRHEARVRDVCFSPDGTRLATGVLDETVRVWNVADGRPAGPAFPLPGPVSCVGFSPEGNLLAGCSMWGPLRVWLLQTPNRAVLPLPLKAVRITKYAPDGRQLAIGCEDGRVWVMDGATQQLRNLHVDAEKAIAALAWSPDSRVLAVADSQQPGIRLYDAAAPLAAGSDKAVPAFELPSTGALALDISPDGRFLAEGTAHWVLRIWSLAERRVVRTIRCREQVWDVRFVAGGREILSAQLDGTIRRWNVETGEPSGATFKYPGPVRSICLWEDLLISSSGEPDQLTVGIQSFSPAISQSQITMPWLHGLSSLTIQPDGRRLAGVNPSGKVVTWKLPTPPPDLENVPSETIRLLGVRRDANHRLVDAGALE